MPFIPHGRYRGGNQFMRYSAVDVQEFTNDNHSKFFDASKFEAAQSALRAQNAPKLPAPVVETDPREAEVREFSAQELARLLGLTVKALRSEAARAMVEGRSRMRKADLVEALHQAIVVDFEASIY